MFRRYDMPQFNNKEEYEKWKAERLRAGGERTPVEMEEKESVASYIHS